MAAAEATAADTPHAAEGMGADTAVVPRCAAAAIMAAAPQCAAADIAAGTPFAAEGDIMAALRCAAHACTSAAGTMAARDWADARPDRGPMPDAPSGLPIRPDARRTSGATHIVAPLSAARRGRSIGLPLRAATTAASPEER